MIEGREDQADAGDVVEFLLEQHRRVRRLLTDVLETTGQERQYNFDEAREMLARHETGEEMIVHPLTRHVPNGDAVADARMAEENKAKDSLADLEDMDVEARSSSPASPGSGRWCSTTRGRGARGVPAAPAKRRPRRAGQGARPGQARREDGPDAPAPERADDDRQLRGRPVRRDARPGPGRAVPQLTHPPTGAGANPMRQLAREVCMRVEDLSGADASVYRAVAEYEIAPRT
jgi:Hemerythrin HHE cation binding domain